MMTNSTTITAAIESAADLDELFEAISSYEDDDVKIDEVQSVDMCALPTFGGDEPMMTAGVWSWDATRVLASDLNGGFCISSREEYFGE